MLTAIVIDDSTLQRMTTTKLVKDNPNLQFTAAYSNPKEGLDAVNQLCPDVVFLDVEMPGLDGFGVIESLTHNCQVILNSTRSDFSLRAFAYEEVKDFVSKPMKKERFNMAVNKVVQNQLEKSLENKELHGFGYGTDQRLAS